MMEDIIALKNINVETATDNNDEKSEKDKTKQNDEVTVEKKSFLSIEVHSKDDLTNVDEFKKSISNRFKVYGDCALFVKAKRNKELCRYCNKGHDHHDTTNGTEPHLVPTDSFGQLEFMKASRKTRAKYVRLADRTDICDTIDLMKNKWELVNLPKLLISVIGTDETLTWSSNVEQKFQFGLKKIAENTKPWVITNGLDGGVVEYVSSILQGHKYNSTKLIGVTTWGIVAGRQCLRTLDSFDNIFPKYPPVDPLDIAMEGKERANEYFLNRHHSHFLLVDTGKNGVPYGEMRFRSDLEQSVICEQIQSLPKVFKGHRQVKILRSTDYKSKYIPAIQIVVGGTPNTIEHVALTLSVDNANREIVMPVVVVAESGQAADLLTIAYELCDENCISGFAEKKLMSEIQSLFPEITDPQKCLKIFSLLLKIMQNKQDITIFYPNKEHSFDEAILLQLMRRGNEGILSQQASSTSRRIGINPDYINFHFVAQLELTMMWNRADIAKKEILKESKFSFHPIELEELMVGAIVENKCSMVELLLDSGFDIKSFDHDKLGQSYHKKYFENDSILKCIVKLKEGGVLETGFTVKGKRKKNVAKLKYNKSKENEGKKCVNLRYIHDAFILLCGINLTPQYWKPGYQGWEKLKRPFKELFLWAVLCNMQQMAVLFWKRGDDVLARALIARYLYRTMIVRCHRDNVYVDEKVIQELEHNAQEFGNFALGLLDVCSRTDRTLTKQLLSEPLQNWGDQSCVKLAAASKFQEFIAHPACQNIVSEKWLGQLMFYGTGASYKVILALLFFPVAFMYEYTGQNADHQRNFLSLLKRKIHEYYLFHTAPITKFWMNVLSFLVFVSLFGFVMYTKFEAKPSIAEWVVVAIVASFAMEEVRQIAQGRGIFFRQLIQNWWSSSSNKVDFIAIFVFTVGFAVRMVGTSMCVEIGRIIYVLDLMVWILRLLDFFSVNETLGPYVVMIIKMTAELFYFAVIFCVFLLSYGIGRYAILEPEGQWSVANLRQFMLIPYFQIFGETALELYGTDKNETIFKTTYNNDYTEAVVVVAMMMYFLLTNLLLVNLLIAVFNNTFVLVQKNSRQVWKWQWYCLVEEYIARPVALPPFVMLSHVAQLIAHLWKKYRFTEKLLAAFHDTSCCRERHSNRSGKENFLQHLVSKSQREYQLQRKNQQNILAEKENTIYELMKFEEDCQLMYLRQLKMLERTSQERTLDEVKDRTNQVEDVLRTTLSEVEKMNSKMNKLFSEMNSITQRLGRVERLNKNLQIPKGSSLNSPRMSPISKTFKRLVSGNPESGEISAERVMAERMNKPQLPTIQDPSSDNILNVIEKLVENVADDNDSTTETVNVLSRSLRYPFSDVTRFYFPDSMIDWKNEFPEYKPRQYTSHAVLAGRNDTDKETDKNIKFNVIDGKVDRRSFCGVYDVIDNRPRNPVGRTGIIGRGCLKRFGPNHIAEPIITRNKSEDESGSFNGLEVLVVEDETGGTFHLPSGEVGPKQKLPVKLRKFFSAPTLQQIGLLGMTLTSTITAFESCFFLEEKNIVVYEGYLDSEKNTDNAWVETSVVNYHDESSTTLMKFFLNESAVERLRLCWIDMEEDASIPEYQLEYLRFVAEKRRVSFESL